MPARILLIHPGGMGDVLLALPAMRAVRAFYAPVALSLMADSAVGTVLQASSEVAHFVPLESRALAELLSGETATPSWWTGDEWEMAVCWMRGPQWHLAHTLQDLGLKRVTIRSPDQATNLMLHQSDRLKAILAEIPYSSGAQSPLRLPMPVLEGGKRKIDRLIGSGAVRTVALHPGSGSRHKCTDPRLFARVAHGLRDIGYHPVLVGGPADKESIDAVAAEFGCPLPVIFGLELLAMAGVLANMALFVGHDSGLTHLAAALHRPTIAVFGPTSMVRWAPQGEHILVITADPCSCKGWDAVRACGDKPCLKISQHQLMRACESALALSRSQDLC